MQVCGFKVKLGESILVSWHFGVLTALFGIQCIFCMQVRRGVCGVITLEDTGLATSEAVILCLSQPKIGCTHSHPLLCLSASKLTCRNRTRSEQDM